MHLYVVTHKESDFLPEGRIFIGVGNNKNIKNVFIYDDTHENISYKNSNYCELTALYWMWKNDHSSIVGLEHYRRFFCKKFSLLKPKILDVNKIQKIMKTKDLILPKKAYLNDTVYGQYKLKHFSTDLDLCKSIIKEKYPQFLKSFDNVMNRKWFYCYNMVVIKKELLDNYCEWLFDVLQELEKIVNINDRDEYQKRIFGFLSERLFNVWIDYLSLDYVEYPVFMPNDIPLKSKIKNILKKIIY